MSTAFKISIIHISLGHTTGNEPLNSVIVCQSGQMAVTLMIHVIQYHINVIPFRKKKSLKEYLLIYLHFIFLADQEDSDETMTYYLTTVKQSVTVL